MKSKLLGLLAVAGLVVACVSGIANSQPSTSVSVSGVKNCTTDSNGYCTVADDLGSVPAHVSVTLTSVAGFASVDKLTDSNFRLRVRKTNGSAYVGSVDFTFAAFGVAGTSPTPTPTTATPTPTETPSGTPTPTPTSAGFPNADTTGVDPQIPLTESGCITAQSNQTYANLSLTDCDINIPDGVTGVVIKNVKFTFTSPNGNSTPIVFRGNSEARISYVTIAGRDRNTGSTQYAIKDINGDAHITIDHANLSNCADCVSGEHVVMTDSYIHSLANPSGAHVDGFQCNGDCSGTIIDHNTIDLSDLSQTGAVSLFSDFGSPHDVTVNNNLLRGGSYPIYAGNSPNAASTSNIKITNNVIEKGSAGYVAGFENEGGNVCSGNTDYVSGAAVSCS